MRFRRGDALTAAMVVLLGRGVTRCFIPSVECRLARCCGRAAGGERSCGTRYERFVARRVERLTACVAGAFDAWLVVGGIGAVSGVMARRGSIRSFRGARLLAA